MTALLPFEDHSRRRLRFEEWPEADRLAWEAAMQPGDLLDGTVGAGYHWAEDTRSLYQKAYGRWLTFLIVSRRIERDAAPADRVTPGNVRTYLEMLETQVSSWTVWGQIGGLHAAIRVMTPDSDWTWLRRIVRRLEGRARDSRNKLTRLRSADEITDWSFTTMDRIRETPSGRFPESDFRTALMIGILIQCPVRLRNITMIRIGTHLQRGENAFRLSFQGGETKTGHPYSAPLPESLTPWIDHYIAAVRPLLLAGNESDRLWITRYGRPMNEGAVYNAITKATRRAFGMSINPHLFRDCAATFVALDDPEHIGIAAPMLGHVDPRTTERHYIQANQVMAGRRLRSSIGELRRRLPVRRCGSA